jgi:oligoribonuclease
MVWIDLEMTGLDPQSDEIVEIAVIVNEADLTEIDEGLSIVIKPNDAPLAAMDDVVVAMHTASGLIDEIPQGTSLSDAESRVLEYVTSHIPEPRKAPLAGSSVYVDRMFLARYMPDLDAHMHYRLVDVSSIKELTALADIRESIAELRYYRDAVMVPPPGPDTSTAKELGNNHVVDHG